MALTVGNIITNRVRVLLRDIDEGGIQWRDSELIDWFNEGCSETARIRPEAHSKTETLPMVAGALQSIPTGGTKLLEAVCNMPNDAEGRVVLRVDRSKLDAENRNWMADPKTDTVYRYCPSVTDPRTFYVYPPSDGTAEAKLRIVYGTPPAALANGTAGEIAASLAASFPLPTQYAAPVANYILYRAFSKLTESAEMQNKAANYLAIFEQQLGYTDAQMETRNANTRDPDTVG
jgi:hypothetical protein